MALIVFYNGPNPALALGGNGIAVTLTAPKSASFSSVRAGSLSSPKTIVISNPSTATVTFGTVELSGSDPDSFKISSDQRSGQVPAPIAKCRIGVEVGPPNSSGTQSATLSVGLTYGANQGNVSTNVSGKVK